MKVKKSIYQYSINSLFLLLVLLFSACSPYMSSDKQKAQACYRRARKSLLDNQKVEIDVVWMLQEILRIGSDRQLEKMVNRRIDELDLHLYRLMVDPKAPRIQLPVDPGNGIDRYLVYMQAPFGFPEDLSISYIEDYLSRQETGYILTHQFAVLLWAEQSGLKLPEHLRNRKVDLLAQIYNEQITQKHQTCMDLYAERVAFLLRYGNVSEEKASDWISELVVTQRKNGTWPSSTHILQYDGQKVTAQVPISHTTALAMLALKSYLEFY